jgi:hypothetical protein
MGIDTAPLFILTAGWLALPMGTRAASTYLHMLLACKGWSFNTLCPLYVNLVLFYYCHTMLPLPRKPLPLPTSRVCVRGTGTPDSTSVANCCGNTLQAMRRSWCSMLALHSVPGQACGHPLQVMCIMRSFCAHVHGRRAEHLAHEQCTSCTQ